MSAKERRKGPWSVRGKLGFVDKDGPQEYMTKKDCVYHKEIKIMAASHPATI